MTGIVVVATSARSAGRPGVPRNFSIGIRAIVIAVDLDVIAVAAETSQL
jgi:hypothetical protein